jgi:hypothetical protein
LAASGCVPADRNASDCALVEAVISGEKPTALISVWSEAQAGSDPPAVERACHAGLVVWRNREGLVADGIVFIYAISKHEDAMAELLRAFTMPVSVVERQIQLGRALGYTWPDIYAFITRSYGRYPALGTRTWLALKGSIATWRWKRRTGAVLGDWVLVTQRVQRSQLATGSA